MYHQIPFFYRSHNKIINRIGQSNNLWLLSTCGRLSPRAGRLLSETAGHLWPALSESRTSAVGDSRPCGRLSPRAGRLLSETADHLWPALSESRTSAVGDSRPLVAGSLREPDLKFGGFLGCFSKNCR